MHRREFEENGSGTMVFHINICRELENAFAPLAEATRTQYSTGW
jgi:hypothetical protein